MSKSTNDKRLTGGNQIKAGDIPATTGEFALASGSLISVSDSLLLRLIITVKAIWQKGWFCSIGQAWQRSYAVSASRRGWEGFMGRPDPVGLSWYGRTAVKLGLWLDGLGKLLNVSLLARALGSVSRVWARLGECSVVFGMINRLNLRQWLLVFFAFYLPLEYIIRDKIGIAILASVWEELFILAAIALIVWQRAKGSTAGLQRETSLDVYILLFMAVGLLLMMLVRPFPAVAFPGYRAVVTYMVWFFLIIRLVADDRDAKVLYGAFLCMAGLLCLHGVYQYVVAVPIPESWVSQTELGVRTRVFSLTGSPNILGSLIVLTAPMMASMAYYLKRSWAKFLFVCLTGMMCLCLLFTFSRGAWVGMVVAVLLFALFVDRRLIAIMGAAGAAALALVPSITSRLTYLFTTDYAEASAIGGRVLRWEVGRLLLTDNNPWLGFGLGRFGGAVAMNNQILDETETFEYFYMDNYYLKTMVEMGYIGLIFFLVLLAAFVIWGLRAVYRSGLEARLTAAGKAGSIVNGSPSGQPEHLAARADFLVTARAGLLGSDALLRNIGNKKIPAVGILAGQIGVLTHCYFENIFEEPYMMAYFWGLAGLLFYIGFFSGTSSPSSTYRRCRENT
jgi:O-antigen ligase